MNDLTAWLERFGVGAAALAYLMLVITPELRNIARKLYVLTMVIARQNGITEDEIRKLDPRPRRR